MTGLQRRLFEDGRHRGHDPLGYEDDRQEDCPIAATTFFTARSTITILPRDPSLAHGPALPGASEGQRCHS